ncbi:MAG: FAD-binding oxidoreductase [Terriglobia bacterium]
MTPSIHRAFVRSVSDLNPRTRQVELEVATDEPFGFHPGQFIALHVGSNGRSDVRAYSIANTIRAGSRFELLINVTLEDKTWFLGLKAGDEVRFTGPCGAFSLRRPPDRVSAFIAHGTGIAPIRAMLQELYTVDSDAEAWLIFGVRRKADILFREEFEQRAKENPGFHFVPTLSSPDSNWAGHTGYVQKHVRTYLAGLEGFHAYVCGRPEMVEDVRSLLLEIGYTADAVSFERYQ